MKLTGTKVAEAKPADRERKLSDGGGLYLLVKPNGTKSWRYKYRFNGRELTLAIGLFPEISLKQARQRHQAAREMLASGIDPNQDKRDRKHAVLEAAGNTFGAIAADWSEVKLSAMSSATIKRNGQILRDYLIPAIGHRPADEIRPAELLTALRRVEATGAMAHRETPHRPVMPLSRPYGGRHSWGRTPGLQFPPPFVGLAWHPYETVDQPLPGPV